MADALIVRDPDVLGGKPVVKGTRVPVELVLKRLAQDLSIDGLLESYPRLTREDIRACIVLKPGASASADDLRAFCLTELGRYKTPREFRFVDELPKGPSGKIQRLKLLEA